MGRGSANVTTTAQSADAAPPAMSASVLEPSLRVPLGNHADEK